MDDVIEKPKSAKPRQRRKIIVKDFPYEQSARAIMAILQDGHFHSSHGIPEKQPFVQYKLVHDWEVADFIMPDGDPDADAVEIYKYKKRRIVLDQLGALKLLGLADMQERTMSSTYGFNAAGMQMIRGLLIMEEAAKHNLSFTQVWQKLFPGTPTPTTDSDTD